MSKRTPADYENDPRYVRVPSIDGWTFDGNLWDREAGSMIRIIAENDFSVQRRFVEINRPDLLPKEQAE